MLRSSRQVSGGAGRRLRPDLPLGPAGVEEAATAEGRGGAPRVPDPPLRPRALPDQRLLSRNNVRYGSRKILQQTCEVAAEVGAAAVIVHAGHAEDGIEEGVGRWPRTLEMLESSVPILIENTAGGENAVARFDALARLWEAVSKSKSGIEIGSASTPATPTPPGRSSATPSSGWWRSSAGSICFTRTTRAIHREPSGPSREPRQGRDQRGGAPRDDQGGRPAGDRRNAGGARQMRADLDFVRSALVSR